MEMLIAILLIAGAGFTLIGSLGLWRLPDLYMRLHGPSKATTLGLGCLLIASMLHFSRSGWSLQALLVTFFLLLTAPISAQLLARAGLARRVHSQARAPDDGHATPPAAADD